MNIEITKVINPNPWNDNYIVEYKIKDLFEERNFTFIFRTRKGLVVTEQWIKNTIFKNHEKELSTPLHVKHSK